MPLVSTKEYLEDAANKFLIQQMQSTHAYVMGANENLLLLLDEWGDNVESEFDYNGDGNVDGADLGILLITEGGSQYPPNTDDPPVVSAFAEATRLPGVLLPSYQAPDPEPEETPTNIGALATQPDNQNYIYPTFFNFTIAEMPNLEYFVTKVTLPGFGYDSPLEQPNRFSLIKHPANKVVFSPLEMSFLVDENMENWLEISNWIRRTSVMDDHRDILEDTKKHFTQGTLFITNSAMNPNLEVTFYNMFPISVSGFEFDSQITDLTPWTANVTFAYDYYEIKKL